MADDFSIFKLLEPIKRRIFLLIGRAVLTAIKASEKTQTIQVTSLDGETISDVEHMQPFGLEAYPNSDTEAIILFINGNRDQGIAITVSDRDKRPKDLQQGDTCLYDSRGQECRLGADKVHLKDSRGQEVHMTATEVKVKDAFGNHITMTAAGITIATGDSVIWQPNILPVDPVTGVPHGGAGAGIVKLKGGI